jgi:response regulator RpfG family c-di-GMP phosphodiesterase
MQMPGMNGIDFLIQVETQTPDTIRIMLTGNADQKTARDAVNQGHIFRFLTKPCPLEELVQSLHAGLRQHALVTAERVLLERTLNGSVKMLTDILSMQDPEAFGQGRQLRDYMRAFAQSLNISQTWDLELAAMLSPIGWVTVPGSLRQKARSGHGLSGPEKDILGRVPRVAFDLLSNIPRLESVARIILYQGKNYDGSGTPADGVAGDALPVGSRILHVLLDLMEHERTGLPKHKALERMKGEAGSRYDPRVIAAVAAGFDIHLPADAEGSEVLSLSFNELRVRDVLKSDLLTMEGTLIVSAGTEISPMLLQKFRNFARLSGIREPIQVRRG